jgi:hypothetical protein
MPDASSGRSGIHSRLVAVLADKTKGRPASLMFPAS